MRVDWRRQAIEARARIIGKAALRVLSAFSEPPKNPNDLRNFIAFYNQRRLHS
jgi:hypothetical protein